MSCALNSRLICSWFVFFVVVTLGCLPGMGSNAEEKDGEKPIAVGWVQAAGEIRIYFHKSDLGRLYDGSCLSGVMTRGRTMPPELQNHRVYAYGKLLDAKELSDATKRGISIGVENYCNSPKIALIERLVPADSDGK